MTTLGPFRFFADRDGYLSALRCHRPGIKVPVLGAPGVAHELVASRSDVDPVRYVPDHREVLVVSLRGSRVSDVAHALAGSVDGRWVALDDPREIGTTGDSADYVVVVGLADEFNERCLMLAHDTLWQCRSSTTGGHLGVLTAADARDLSWLIAKGMALPHRTVPFEDHVRVWPAVLGKVSRYGTGRWVLRDDATAETLRPVLLENHTGALSVLAHGRDDVLHLNDTVICPTGATAVGGDGHPASHAPVCAFTGRCYRPEVAPGDIIRAGQVLADAVFTNSCMGMRVSEGLYPTDYLMPHGFIRGFTAAYLASGQIVNGLVKLNDIFHTACATGRSLGETATLINDHLRHERVDLPYFTLVGLPWLTLNDPSSDDSPWLGFRIASGNWASEGSGLRAASVAVAVDEQFGRSAHVIHASPRSAAVLAGAVSEKMDMSRVPALEVTLQSIGRSMTNLDDVQFTGLKYSRQNNMLVTVRDQVAALANSLNVAALRGDASKIKRKIQAVTQVVERAELTLAEAVFERGMQSFQHYNDVWGETLEMDPPDLTDDECPYCARPIVRYRATQPVLPRIARDALVCARCGMIRDCDVRSPVAQLIVETDELWYCEGTHALSVRLRLHGGSAHPANVAVGAFMANGAKNGVTFPGPRTVPVSADGSVTLDLQAEVADGARMHQEYVRAVVVAEGTLSFVSRPVWVRPALVAINVSNAAAARSYQ
jgi:hypothetical protein